MILSQRVLKACDNTDAVLFDLSLYIHTLRATPKTNNCTLAIVLGGLSFGLTAVQLWYFQGAPEMAFGAGTFALLLVGGVDTYARYKVHRHERETVDVGLREIQDRVCRVRHSHQRMTYAAYNERV